MVKALANITPTHSGMIQIRADLSRAGDAIAEAAGLAVPAPLSLTTDGSRTLLWMSPDELLLALPVDEVAAAVGVLQDALAGEHALVLDVSAMRAQFLIQGPKAEQVLMKISPTPVADLPADAVRRTRAAQVACAFWREGQGFRLIGFRSVAEYLEKLLTTAARPGTELDPR